VKATDTMAKRQTRRSISVKGITYQRLKDYCDATGKSVSGYLEDIIAEKLDAAGAPIPTVLKPRVQRKEEPVVEDEPEEIVSQHFTF
jgi:hypothetical protein